MVINSVLIRKFLVLLLILSFSLSSLVFKANAAPPPLAPNTANAVGDHEHEVQAHKQENNDYKMVGYYPSWATYARNFQVTDIDPTKINVINYAFANISGGKIVVGDPYADTDKFFPGDCWDTGCKRGNFNELAKLKAAHPNIKTLISVGGWTWSGNFSSAAATDASRDTFANSAVDFVRAWGFDGVDIDWEYPVSGGLQSGSPKDKANFTLLLQAMRSALDSAGSTDGKQYYLTIAAGAGPSYIQNTELRKIQKFVDWINLMSYDYHGSWETLSNNNAPLYFDPNDKSANASSYYVEASVKNFKNAGVPASKLVLGLPFYGRGWGGCPSTNNGLYQTCSGASSQGTWEAGIFDFSDLQANYINKNGYTRYWNSNAGVPYLYNPSNGVYISYDDEQSISQKDSYVKTNGLAGVMIWDLSSDRNRTLETQIVGDLGNP